MGKTIQEKKDLFDAIQNSVAIFSDLDAKNDVFNSTLAGEIDSRSDEDEKSILKMLYKVNTIRISENSNCPFEPYITLSDNKATCKPSFLTDEELDLLVEVFDITKNKMLKARIADILWYLKYKKDIKYANFLIPVYTSIDISTDDSFFENILFYKRGLSIAKQLKKDLTPFETILFNVFSSKIYKGNSQLLFIAKLLRSYSFAKSNASIIKDKLIDFGSQLETNENFILAEQYYDEASFWANDENEYIQIQVLRVKTYIHFAEHKESSGISTEIFYTKAIELLRALKKETRELYFSEDELSEIIKKKQDSGKLAVSNMCPMNIPMDNINALILQVKSDVINSISGKTKGEALFNFSYSNFIKASTFEQQAIQMNNSCFFALSNMSFYGNDGRKIGATYGTTSVNPTSKNPQIFNMMVYHYSNYLNLITPARILTGLDLINSEHHVSYHDIKTVVHESYLFADDREESVCKGLLAGFLQDFISSLNLLAPQFENLIRTILHQNGEKTITIGDDGKETEIGLSGLVKIANFENIFGKDLTFEIRALLCESIGPNLRNNTAHGLLNDYQMSSYYSVYFWWFFLNFVYKQFYRNNGSYKIG